MTTVYDVPAEPLIAELATQLRDDDVLTAPDWAPFARTGAHKELPPEQDEWWSTRAAAVLRKVYINGPIGTERLAGHFGGKRTPGTSPHHTVKGSRSIIRKVLQQLENADLVKQDEAGRGGREVTPEGHKLLDDLAHEVKEDLTDEIPELARY